MSKQMRDFKKPCLEMFTREHVVNMKTVMETLKNSQETLITQNLPDF